MRYQKGLILTTVFILSACYFSFISFGDTAQSVSGSVQLEEVGNAEAFLDTGEKTDKAKESGKGKKESAFWQTGREDALNDLVYRSGMRMEAGTSLNIILPKELFGEADRVDAAIFNLETGEEVYRKEDCRAGDTIYWKSLKSGRYHAEAFLKTGERTENVGLDEYALLEVQDFGSHAGGVIPL